MAQKLEDMMNEFRYPPVITTDKDIVSSGSITSTVGFFGASQGIALFGATGSASVAGGSASLSTQRGRIDTGSVTTGSLGVYTFTLLNSLLSTSSSVFTSVYNGSNTGGAPVAGQVAANASGSMTISIVNAGSASAFNGSLIVNFLIVS